MSTRGWYLPPLEQIDRDFCQLFAVGRMRLFGLQRRGAAWAA